MPEEAKVRISEELYERVKQIAEKQNRTIKEIVEEAVKAYILGLEQVDKPVKSIQNKIIPLQYDSKCKVCGRPIKAGELAYWVRYTFTDNTAKSYVVCLDCYYKDTALAEGYIRKKKLEAIVRGLQKKADSLVQEIERLQTQHDIAKLKADIFAFWRNVKDAILNQPDVKVLDKFFNDLNSLIERVNALEASIEASMSVEAKKRKKARIESSIR